MPQPTVQIPFGSTATDNVYAFIELDDETNVDEKGNILSTFLDTERVNILVHLESGAEVRDVYTSQGSIINELTAVQVTRTETVEEVFFKSSEDKYQLQHYPVGGVTATWEGRTGNPLTVSGRDVTCPVAARVADLTYSYRAWLYILQVGSLNIEEGEDYKVEVSFDIRRA